MRLLLISDSHGRRELLSRVLSKEEYDTVIFLGDGYREAEYFRELYKSTPFICVRGNNDYGSDFPEIAYKHLQGVTLVACHGHLLSVRVTRRYLFDKAESVMAQLALYGHTHVQRAEYDNVTGVCALNPGALCDGRYCIVTLTGGSYDISFREVE